MRPTSSPAQVHSDVSRLTAIWLVAIGLLSGCGHPMPAEQSQETKPSTATRATSKATDSSAEQTVANAPLVLADEGSPTAGDAKREGWQTEAFSELASRQLHELGKALEAEGIPPAQLQTLLDDNFRATPLLPEGLHTVHEDKTVRVERLVLVDNNPSAPVPTDPQEAFASLIKAFADFPVRKTKFKLFRVEMAGPENSTRQYFHISGRSTHKAREVNATWSISWSAGDEEHPPRIRSIQVEQLEQVTSAVADQSWLVDCTQSVLGQDTAFRQGLQVGVDHWLSRLESIHGIYNFGYHGLALGDVNGDGLDDLYVCQVGGLPNHLFIQQPNGTLRDMAAAAHVDFLDNTRSALLIDLDNDGDQDMVLALVSGMLFLENDGTGRFYLRARINRVRQAFSLAAADYDQDGRLDVYACVYYGSGNNASELPLPMPYFDATNGGQNYLIRNLGDWRFADVTAEVGLDDDNHRFSFAATWEDYDNDGDQDLLVVNDFGPNNLYRNDSGHFRNVAKEVGLVDGAFGMASTWSDFDHSGQFDLYVANMFSAAGNRVTFQPGFKRGETDQTRSRFRHLARGNSLFRNQGNGTFADVSVEMGVTMGRWSWSSLFVDLNNDSWDDLLVTNGFITGTQTDDL
jgi:hypothetical protein